MNNPGCTFGDGQPKAGTTTVNSNIEDIFSFCCFYTGNLGRCNLAFLTSKKEGKENNSAFRVKLKAAKKTRERLYIQLLQVTCNDLLTV